jgi:predicted dehydrogenase
VPLLQTNSILSRLSEMAEFQSKMGVVIIGCGLPERGMGWYHAKQILDGEIPHAELSAVVEPWFLGAGASSDAGIKFAEWKASVESNGVTTFHSSLDTVAFTATSLALIAGRTADNPKLLRAVVDKGCKFIYLEKPGAPTVGELEGMKKYADDNGVKVYMGYNKNVTKYVRLAREVEEQTPGAVTTFIHNNAYKPEELAECFERNCEGMLKNMAVHELALLVTYYGVSVQSIESVEFDTEYTSCQTIGKFTDFDRIGFTIRTQTGKVVSVKANRCGGSYSNAIVESNGEEVFRSVTPDAELETVVSAKQAANPGYMPYFFLQHDDYITLKETVTAHVMTGAPGNPPGIATIEIAIETLKVAEYLTARALNQFGSTMGVVIIGCGLPERGMGWYHAKQLLDVDITHGKLAAIVEPYFLGPGASTEAGVKFAAWKDSVQAAAPTQFYASLSDVEFNDLSLALIAGRTADNPRLLKEVIDKGCKYIYLEKPGAPSVAELEEMARYAEANGVKVFMGYNKNVTKYVRIAREAESKFPGSVTTFIHNNAYKPEELAECFERNCEGMLKNMAVHELALLVTYYDVTVENIESVEFDSEYTSCQTLGKFTDFDKVGFTIRTKSGKTVSVKANRCGGSYSNAIVELNGEEVFRSVTPDAELETVVNAKQAANPGYMPYFFLQHDDYITLKETVTKHVVSGAEGSPPGIATIEIAIDTLKVAEYLTALALKQFASL